MDWTLWFVPIGESGRWVARLLRGIANGEPEVLSLLDTAAFHQAFPTSPPALVRLSEVTYRFDAGTGATWLPTSGSAEADEAVRTVVRRSAELAASGPARPLEVAEAAWPSLAPLRLASDRLAPEQFIWAWFAVAAVVAAGRAAQPAQGPASGGVEAALGMSVPEVLALLRARQRVSTERDRE